MKPDREPEEQFPEPDNLEPVIIPLPQDIPGVTPSPGPIALGQPTGGTTPGPPAVGPLAWSPSPSEIIRTAGGDSVLGGDVIDEARKELLRVGEFDAFIGVVMAVDYAVAHKSLGLLQGITVERVDVRWDATTNKPLDSVTPSPGMGSTNIVDCKPWPGRHDQALYHVKEGDIVTVLRGADGLSWFMVDDLPFVGTVVAWDDDYVTEEFSGGADDYFVVRGLKVRQQAITGNPTTGLATLADLETIADAWVTETAYIVDDIVLSGGTTYRCKVAHTSGAGTIPPHANWEADNVVIHRYVNIVRQDNVNTGYRVGDNVLVFRRGLYLFCTPARQTFLGVLSVGVESGPSDAADFTDEHYWVQETSSQVTYATDAWTFALPPQDQLRDTIDPTGSGGRMGRWIDAVNLAERTDETHLLADNVLVEVTMWSDEDDYPYYTFDHAVPAATELGDETYKVKVSDDDTTPEFLDEKITADETWITVAEINPAGDEENDEDWEISHIGPNTSLEGYFIQITGLTGTVQDTVCTCKDAVCGIRIDIKGHIFAYEASGSSNWKNWPTGAPDYS
jgi:hypothetical protein